LEQELQAMAIEFYIILAGAGVVVLAWLLLRFGKIIARWVLIFGVLAAVIILGLVLLAHAQATQTAVRAATVAGAGAAGISAMAVILTLMLLTAAGIIGWLAVRLKVAEGKSEHSLPPRPKRQRFAPKPEPEPMIFVLESETEEDIIDLSRWGW
jgi:chromate transport protein ChrA